MNANMFHYEINAVYIFSVYNRVWDTRNMQPAFTFPAQQYFQVFHVTSKIRFQCSEGPQSWPTNLSDL